MSALVGRSISNIDNDPWIVVNCAIFFLPRCRIVKLCYFLTTVIYWFTFCSSMSVSVDKVVKNNLVVDQDARIFGKVALENSSADVEETMGFLYDTPPNAYQPTGGNAYWTLAAGVAVSNGSLSMAANGRCIVSGNDTGIRYCDLNTSVPTVISATPTAGVFPATLAPAYNGAGLIVARTYFTTGAVWRSLDNGVTYTQVPGVFTVGQSRILWDPVDSWFMVGVAVNGFEIETSPDGITWTPRPTPLGASLSSILPTSNGRWIATRSAAGPLWSDDRGVTWTASSGGAPSGGSIAAGTNLIIIAFSTDWWISTDGGQSFAVAVGTNPDNRLTYRIKYFDSLKRFYIAQKDVLTGGFYMSTLPDVVAPVYRPTGALILSGVVLGPVNGLGGFVYDPISRRFAVSGSAPQHFWYSNDLNSNLVAAAGSTTPGASGTVSGNTLVLQTQTTTPPAIPTGATIWYAGAQQLLYRPIGNFTYPLGAFSVRFNGNVSADLYADAFGTWSWDDPTKQLRVTPAASDFFGATTCIVASRIFTGASPMSTGIYTSPVLSAGFTLFAANMDALPNALWDGSALTPTKLTMSISAGSGSTSSLPTYTITIMLTASGNQGNIIIRSDYRS